MYRTVFWTLWERERVGWCGRMALKYVKYHVWNELPVQVRGTILDAWGWCTGMTQRDGMGRRQEGSGWGTHVYLWWIHVDIWQNQYNIVKLNKIKKNKTLHSKKKQKTNSQKKTLPSWKQRNDLAPDKTAKHTAPNSKAWTEVGRRLGSVSLELR